jgi:D-3-phosphoglycerate dehydrogenase / 2-oxoglutarate reductase
MNIAILDDYQNVVPTLASFSKLAGHSVKVWNDHTTQVDALAERLRDTEALVLIRERTPIPAPLLQRLPKLRIISQTGPCPNIDIAACTLRGVIVSSGQYSRPSYATAELTWGLIISALRRIPQEVAALKHGRWQSSVGIALRGRTLGVYGYGRIGAVVAGYGHAFGMKVLVWGRETTLAKARADNVAIAAGKQALFEQSDVLTLHMRLTDATRGIVTAEDLARMKPNALLVNTSRAALVAPDALEHALRAGRPGMAAVDVYEEEPVLGARHPLLILDNAVCTPHLGYVERDGYEFLFGNAFDQVLACLAGKPVNVVNPEVLGRK